MDGRNIESQKDFGDYDTNLASPDFDDDFQTLTETSAPSAVHALCLDYFTLYNGGTLPVHDGDLGATSTAGPLASAASVIVSISLSSVRSS